MVKTPRTSQKPPTLRSPPDLAAAIQKAAPGLENTLYRYWLRRHVEAVMDWHRNGRFHLPPRGAQQVKAKAIAEKWLEDWCDSNGGEE